jgi:hypothetical protein
MEPTLATAIQENLGVPCRSDETIREITRGIRFHFTKFVKPLANGLLEQAQLGLGHSYSRSKVHYQFILLFAVSLYDDDTSEFPYVQICHDDFYVSTFTLT